MFFVIIHCIIFNLGSFFVHVCKYPSECQHSAAHRITVILESLFTLIIKFIMLRCSFELFEITMPIETNRELNNSAN